MKHHVLRKRLQRKGWVEEDIEHAIDHFLDAEEKKHPLLKKLDKSLIWVALLASIIINLVIAFALIPLFLIMPTAFVIFCLVFIGVCFGLLTDVFVREIEHYTHHHYIAAGIILPILSLISIFAALRIGNIVSVFFPYARAHDSFMLAAVYFLSFSLPHVILKYFEIKEVHT